MEGPAAAKARGCRGSEVDTEKGPRISFLLFLTLVPCLVGFYGGSEFACHVGDLGSIPGLGRSPGGGHDNALQYSCLENPMDRRAWWAIINGVTRVSHDLAAKPSTTTTVFQFSQLCPTLCSPIDCSTPGFPIHHQLLELAQTHVHRVSDAIQPSHPLSSPSPPAFNLSQHQGLQ